MSTNKPSLRRQKLRSTLQFTNPFQPFQNHSSTNENFTPTDQYYPITTENPEWSLITTQCVIRYVNYQISGTLIDSNVSASIPISKSANKTRFRKSSSKPTSKTALERSILPRSRISFSNENNKSDIFSSSSDVIEEEEEEEAEVEVHLAYNNSNMPKYVGEFVNVQWGDKDSHAEIKK